MADFSHLDNTILRRIIIDRYSNPKHKISSEIKNNLYKKLHLKSKTCVDELSLYIFIKNNKVLDYKYMGSACSICIASTDILGDLIINNNFIYINKIINNYKCLINNNSEINSSLLYELIALHNTHKFPARKKCALLSANGIQEIINNNL